ncbi:DUF1003 domain-containing protein [Phormidium tenue FACHB-886]|nr:DUF1003 domain-containing protein [Phormidium tenue FACHB-886]
MHQQQAAPAQTNSLPQGLEQSGAKQSTFGQKLADKLAAKVGSWPFLIGQSTVLAGWVGCNLVPGLPHWDESPFIMLNLVFSFASAYTAPIVLMSQNRQSDEDREHARLNYQVNLQTAENLQLLQTKMDDVYSQKMAELTQLIQQQQALNAAQASKAAPESIPPASNTPESIAPEPTVQFHIPHYIGLLPNQVSQVKPKSLAAIAEESLLNPQVNAPASTFVEPITLLQPSSEQQ